MKWVISMPRVDPAMERGVVLKIMKKVGEKVSKNEVILKVMTEKATFEIHSPYEGFVTKIFHNEGEELNVGEPILEISDEAAGAAEPEEVLATPAAKRLAREHGIDLSKIKGTGPHGRITQEDVLRYVEQSKHAVQEERISLSAIRRIITSRVEQSYKEIPQLTVNTVVKVSKLIEHRKKTSFSIDSYVIYASSRALREFTLLNSEFKEGYIVLKKQINIAFAVGVDNELYMPVIRNADLKSLEEIEKEHSELVEKCRKGSLSLDDLQGSTFAITNLGPYEVLSFNPLIYPTNAAILGVGKIHYEVESDGLIFSVVPAMILSLSFDHRIVDGAYAGAFLKKIKEIIENGEFS